MDSGPPRARPAALAYGVLAFAWLQLEGDALAPVLALGAAGALLAARPARRRPLPLAGALIGATAAVLGAALMLLKNGLHGHGAPDFAPAVVLGIAARAPVWALAGALVGLAAVLLRGHVHHRADSRNAREAG